MTDDRFAKCPEFLPDVNGAPMNRRLHAAQEWVNSPSEPVVLRHDSRCANCREVEWAEMVAEA